MNYFEMITDCLDYVEAHLDQEISLEELAERYHLSKYHFYRIFRAVTHKTLKTYIDERRLSEAAKALRETEQNIIDIALEHGFQSHESFSRSFKKKFYLTPNQYRNQNVQLKLFERPTIIEREFRNQYKEIVVRYEVREESEFHLIGDQTTINLENEQEVWQAKRFVEKVVERFIQPNPNLQRLYSVSQSDKSRNHHISYFVGVKTDSSIQFSSLTPTLSIPKSKYAVFTYKGVMAEIFPTVLDDLYRCICIAQLQLNPIGIDFIEVYEQDYEQNHRFSIYLPILT